MSGYAYTCWRVWVLMALLFVAGHALAQQPGDAIPEDTIAALQDELSKAKVLSSATRQKLALRRVARDAESSIGKHPSAPNRFEVIHLLFQTQQAQYELQGSETQRRAILDTCELLAKAPDSYAELRWDADLLLSQVRVARQGGGAQQRTEAMRELVDRYLGTSVEKKAVRTALLMAVEAGEARLITYLDQLISERFADDLKMIAFKRDQLPAQVFGATFYAAFRDNRGNTRRFPMDSFGTTTAFLFWSKDKNGLANLKEIGEVLKEQPLTPDKRIAIFSVNLDGLADAGESILREHGIDWPALHLPGGRDSDIYRAYARVDPKFVTISPTGIASLFQTGGNMHGKGFKRWLGSSSARMWVRPDYCSKLQSLTSGEFLILEPDGTLDPASPPELKVLITNRSGNTADSQPLLERGDQSVPDEKLLAIQACFTPAPERYLVSYEQAIAGYQKAEALCAEAIKAHAGAQDLWLVRNRRMVALMGLWKVKYDPQYLKLAAEEAKAALKAGYPDGADVIARLCLARQAVHDPDAETRSIIRGLSQSEEGKPTSAPRLANAALLALELGERDAYASIRQTLLEQHGNEPMLWPLTAFMLDRYHRFWLYQIPFVSGHIYGRRHVHGMSNLEPERGIRRFNFPLKTLDGNAVGLPEESRDKWTLLRFFLPEQLERFRDPHKAFIDARPLKDIQTVDVVLGDDAEAIQQQLAKRKTPWEGELLCVSDDVRGTLERQFGMQHDNGKPSILILRPDGTVAMAASEMTYRGMGRGDIIPAFFLRADEARVDQLLAQGEVEQAKRVALTYVPLGTPAPPEDRQTNKGSHRKPVAIADQHLRARAKVHVALGQWEAALADVELLHDALVQKASLMGMRTDELEAIEQMRAQVLDAMDPDKEK